MKIDSVLLFVLGLNCYTIIFAAHQDVITEVLQNAPMPCEEAGFFRHPLDCRYFYRCVTRTKGNFQRYIFSCPFYTVFDSETSVCVPPFMTNVCDTVDPPSPMLKLDQYYNRFSAGNNQGFNGEKELPVITEEGDVQSEINNKERQQNHPFDSQFGSDDSLTIQDLDMFNSQDYQVPHLEEVKGQFGEGVRKQSQRYREETEPAAVEYIDTSTDDYEEITPAEELTTKAPTKTYHHKKKIVKPITKRPVNTYKEVTTEKPQETTYEEPTTTKPIRKSTKPIKKYKDSMTTIDITTEKPVKKYKESTTVKPKSPKTQKPASKYTDSSTKKPNLEPKTKKPIETYKKEITNKPIEITKSPSNTYKQESQFSTQMVDEEYHQLDMNVETTTNKLPDEVIKKSSNTYQDQSKFSTDDVEHQENQDDFNINSKTKTQFPINIKNSKNKKNSQKNSNSQEHLIGASEEYGEEFQIHGGPIDVKTPDLDQQELKTTGQDDEKIIERHENEHEYLDESEVISDESNSYQSNSISHFQPSSENEDNQNEFIGYEDLAQVTKSYNKPNYKQKITRPTKRTYASTSTTSAPLPSTSTNKPAKKDTYSNQKSNVSQSPQADYGQAKNTKSQNGIKNDRYKENQVSHESSMELTYENNGDHSADNKQQTSRVPMEIIINSDYEDAFNNEYSNNGLGPHVRVHPGHRRKETLENFDWHSYSTNQPIEQDQYEYNYQESPQFSPTEINAEQYEHHKNKFVKPIKVASTMEPSKNLNQDVAHAEDDLYEEILNEFEPSTNRYTLPPYHQSKIDMQLDDSSFYDDFSDIEEAVTPKARPTRPTRPTRPPRPTRRTRPVKPNIKKTDHYDNTDGSVQEENSEYKPNQNEFEQIEENSDQNYEEATEGPKEKANPSYKKKADATTTTTTKKTKYEHKAPMPMTTQKPRYRHTKPTTIPTTTTTTTTTPKPRYEHRKPTPKVIKKTKPPTYKQTTEKPATTTEEQYEYFDEELTTANAIYGKEPEKQAEEIKATTVISIISSSGEYEDYGEDIVHPETTTPAKIDISTKAFNESDFGNETTPNSIVEEVTTLNKTDTTENLTEFTTAINIVENTTPFKLPNVPAASGGLEAVATTPQTVAALNGLAAIGITAPQAIATTPLADLPRPVTGTLNDRTENKPPQTNSLTPTSDISPAPTGNTAFETDSGTGTDSGNSAPISVGSSENTAPAPAGAGTPSRNPLEPPPLAARDVLGSSLKRKLENKQ